MKLVITEEMRYRKKVVEYAIKYNNNAAAARRYDTSRQNVKRWRDRYDGSWDSLRNLSRRQGYKCSYDSMCKQIREKGWNRTEQPVPKKYPKTNWKPTLVSYPGEKVQIDIKYVPTHCVAWDSHGKRYYQITAIDEYS